MTAKNISLQFLDGYLGHKIQMEARTFTVAENSCHFSTFSSPMEHDRSEVFSLSPVVPVSKLSFTFPAISFNFVKHKLCVRWQRKRNRYNKFTTQQNNIKLALANKQTKTYMSQITRCQQSRIERC